MISTIEKDMGKDNCRRWPCSNSFWTAESFAKLIRMGYVNGLLAGNALAVHDVENALMGTSLGMHVIDVLLQ